MFPRQILQGCSAYDGESQEKTLGKSAAGITTTFPQTKGYLGFSAQNGKTLGKINKLKMEDPSNVAPGYFPNDAEIAIAEQRYQEVDLPLPLPRPLPPSR